MSIDRSYFAKLNFSTTRTLRYLLRLIANCASIMFSDNELELMRFRLDKYEQHGNLEASPELMVGK